MLKLSQPNISEAAIAAVADVLRSGQLVHGAEGEAFEAELASYLDCSEVVLVSSGTAALHLAVMALGVGPGDAVFVPDFTFPATANVIALTGARPVIIDVDPRSYTMDLVQLGEVLAGWNGPERPRAVMPVHEFGAPVDMARLGVLASAHGLDIIEDAACALGARSAGRMAGALGRVGCFSFHPRKTLTTGEGGALATDDADLARRLRRLRNHGMERGAAGMQFFEAAPNYRLTNFQSALGRAQLPQLDRWIAMRRELVGAYHAVLAPLAAQGLIALPPMLEGHSWQTFLIVLADGIDRAKVIAALREQQIEANLGAQSLSSLGIYGDQPLTPVNGPRLYRQGLALPLCEQMSHDDVAAVGAGLSRALAC